jgi:diguanylate cyclase (GGDEF)-like protein
MLSALNILLIASLFCVVMLLALFALRRSAVPGIAEWATGNALAAMAFVFYGFDSALPEFFSYELANVLYAAAIASILIGFRRFFSRKVPWLPISIGGAAFVIAYVVFHLVIDSYPLRTITVSAWHGAICLAIAATVFRTGSAKRFRYSHLFTQLMALTVAGGHAVRAGVHVFSSAELTALSQPSTINLFFLSANTVALPVLTLGAIMMVNDRMMANAEHAANRDFLTGAWSRRALFELAEREMSRVARSGLTFSLLVLDVDNFKHINDRHGHPAGDQVLIDVVLRAETVIRNVDYFARIGGEEFAMLLPDTPLPAALVVAERLRAALERQVPIAGSKGSSSTASYTVSVGLAELQQNESFTELLARADSALYKAKVGGRNLVVVATHDRGHA